MHALEISHASGSLKSGENKFLNIEVIDEGVQCKGKEEKISIWRRQKAKTRDTILGGYECFCFRSGT